MRLILTPLLLIAAGTTTLAVPAQEGNIVRAKNRSPEGSVMSVSLGENSKMTVHPAEQDRLERFYREVLGCNVIHKSKELDLIQMDHSFFIGVVYDDSALPESELLKSVWLDLRTDRPEALKQKILQFGIKEIEFWDKEHFYFQAPGGQVFRLVGKTEDMSKWQR